MEQDKKFNLDDITERYLANLADEKARQVLPRLWKQLHSDLNYKEPLPEEVLELLGRRLRLALFQFFVSIKVLKMNPKGVINPLAQRVSNAFVRQIKEYRNKYREDMGQTIADAKKGKTKAICRLLEWDKAWIAFSFIHDEISARGYRCRGNDRFFLQLVGKAIEKRPKVRDYAEESGLLSAIELYANQHDLTGNNNQCLKALYDCLSTEEAFEEAFDPENPPAFKDFVRTLKRHHII